MGLADRLVTGLENYARHGTLSWEHRDDGGPDFPDDPPVRSRRALGEDDVDSFIRASTTRDTARPRSGASERSKFLRWVGARYPMRLRRLGRDLDWLRKQARKYGLDEDEIKWLL